MTEDEKGYNGWANYETWNVAGWIDNEEGSYHYARGLARDAVMDSERPLDGYKREAVGILADSLKEWIGENAPEMEASTYSDLMNAALEEVDWYEIAENYLEDVLEDQPENEEAAE